MLTQQRQRAFGAHNFRRPAFPFISSPFVVLLHLLFPLFFTTGTQQASAASGNKKLKLSKKDGGSVVQTDIKGKQETATVAVKTALLARARGGISIVPRVSDGRLQRGAERDE
ncbi:unnamed protein product [Amoebophrya sp. A120]|nr:unnamed protein product [Amoebophrya sp. A120]|eukprot:GSA120T00004563001.1